MTPLPYRQTALSLALSAFVAASALVSTAAEAAARSGSEFLVNTYTSGGQARPGIAVDANGDFVVTWMGNGAETPSTNATYGQRHSRDGLALGGTFRVGIGTPTVGGVPRVAMDADGDFVVVYPGNSTGDADGIFGQRFDKTGTAQGSEFLVNTTTVNVQSNPAIAMDADGDFVVTWLSSGAQDGSGTGIYAQRYNNGGTPQGSEFLVNSYTSGNQTAPSVAMDVSGDFVITWQSSQDGSSDGIYAQRYNASGIAQGAEFGINTYTSGMQSAPAIALDTDGDFVIAWTSSGQDGAGTGVYAQRYDASGVAQGTEFRVNTYTVTNQNSPAIAMDADGDFVIAWQSFGQDGNNNGIYAQRYNAGGAPLGGEFRVNTYTISAQQGPAIAMDADGDFVIAWTSNGQDGNFEGIYAQRYSADTVGPGFTASAGTPTTNAGVYSFTATYCLKAGQPTLANLGSYTLALSNNNSLNSRTTSAYAVPGQAAVPPGGVGSQQDVPITGQYADRALTAGECIAVPYAIGLASNARFSFSVRLRGDTGGTPAP